MQSLRRCASPMRIPAFAAEALALPGEAFLADQMAVVDVDAIHAVRNVARAAIGRALRDELRATYDRLTDTGPYSIDGAAIGRRSLRNACLAYLAADGDAEGIALAKAQFDARQNMTDVLAALAVLSAIDCPERRAALDAFHARWHGDDLVLDKWFAIQAMSPLPDTPECGACAGTARGLRSAQSEPRARAGGQLRVRQSGAVPRSIRQRLSVPGRHHHPARSDEQSGRRADVPPLGQWRRFEPARQALMKQELQRILDAPRLSKGTYEMASRSIA